jgi:hypothetical protein
MLLLYFELLDFCPDEGLLGMVAGCHWQEHPAELSLQEFGFFFSNGAHEIAVRREPTAWHIDAPVPGSECNRQGRFFADDFSDVLRGGW